MQRAYGSQPPKSNYAKDKNQHPAEKAAGRRRRSSSAQAAIEYIVTYGWAILLIAIVAAALFVSGIIQVGTPAKLRCAAGVGYLCTAQTLYSNGTAVVGLWSQQLALVTGTNCTTNTSMAPTVFVPEEAPVNISRGQGQQVSFQCPPLRQIGAPFTGDLYIQYSVGNVTGLIAKIGNLAGRVNKLSSA